jgi:hypothetical protein
MVLIAHASVVFVQLAALLLTAAGWGYGVYWLAGKPVLRAEGHALCVLAGLCGGWILLQDGAYLGARLAWSSWFAAAAAGLGLVGIGRTIARGRRTRSPQSREWLIPGAIVLAVFCFQGSGVISAGPGDYYGYARQDQINYVQASQFLIERPFATGFADVGLHPWLIKAIDTKGMRIGQDIADAYAAVITGTDAATAYGTVSVFFIALTAWAGFALLRCFGASRLLAAGGALWIGVLPGITQTHLDGFYSQASTLFVLPALVLAARVAGRRDRLGLIALPLLLAFLMSAYSEIYVIGLALTLAMALLPRGILRSRRLSILLVALLGPPLLLATYVVHFLRFVASQYRGAAASNALAYWTPYSGTWRGWSQIFLVAPAHHAGAISGQIAVGFALLALIGFGFISRSRTRRSQLAAVALVPAAVLGALLSAATLSQYPFAKLLISFSPLAAALATLGLCRLQLAAPRIRLAPAAALALLVGLAAWSSATKLAVVFANGSGLQTMNTPEARAVYRELDAHPERTYLVAEPHYILNAWFCYHARHADVYSRLAQIGDRYLPPGTFPFQSVPEPATGIWLVTDAGVQPLPPGYK